MEELKMALWVFGSVALLGVPVLFWAIWCDKKRKQLEPEWTEERRKLEVICNRGYNIVVIVSALLAIVVAFLTVPQN